MSTFFKSVAEKVQSNNNSKATTTSDVSTIEISIVQLARKRTLMRSVEQGEYSLQAPPADKMHIRDAPRMESASLKKMYDRSSLAAAIRGAQQLRVVPSSDISDRSAPIIEEGVQLRFSERRAFLNALLVQVEKFYLRVLSTVSHIHHTSLETAIYMRENAPAKVHDIVEAGSSKVHDLYEAGRETAASTQVKASHLIDSGKAAVGKATTEIKVNAQGLLETSKEVVQEINDVTDEATFNAGELMNETGAAIKDTAKEVAQFASTKTSSFATAVKDTFSQLNVKVKSLLAPEHEEILLKKRRPLRRATSEAAIYKAYSQLLLEVEQNRQNLNHVLLSEIRDRSKPFIQSPEARQQNATKQTLQLRGAVLTEIKRSATCMTLNHVSIRDTSRPALPENVPNLTTDSRKKLVAEIEVTDVAQVLHPAACPTSDRSAPVLPFGDSVQLDKFDNTKKSMLELVKAGVDLSSFSPRLLKDRSAPMVVSPGLGSM
eukprot:TRINITY_DN565_c0_g1_i1.p1 TRINITY_DN565_c0_g1~~TRINITY_DN565_c0_g1_i1.p1  ORF type:complete len:489 (+),score=205.19 TRINITY_DN565_c0_g1_i1:111-1577(+)